MLDDTVSNSCFLYLYLAHLYQFVKKQTCFYTLSTLFIVFSCKLFGVAARSFRTHFANCQS